MVDETEIRHSATKVELIAQADYLSPEEKEMIWEINLVRTEPWAYIPHIEKELTLVQNDSVALSKIVSESIHKRVSYMEGKELIEIDTLYQNYYENRVEAIRELLIELDKSIPMHGLSPHQPLHRAAVAHVGNQTSTTYIDHLGADGSWPQERILREDEHLTDGNENIARGIGTPREMIIQLLIDSGVHHRGHRKNILAPEWKYITCYQPRELNDRSAKWWVQEFAY